jgi:NADPH-dependent 2,4-dienoyl-CoA reductase/sulfur reductase-like enzyme
MPTVAPSAIPDPIKGGLPRELTTEEVADLVEAFAQAARRAQEAGFDAVEIQACHGYLVNQFLSPKTNRRSDKYGGDLGGRMTFILEIIARTKELVGNEFPLIVRMNADDFVDGGLVLGDCKPIAQSLETAGVACLDVTAAIYETLLHPRVTSPYGVTAPYAERGQLVEYAKQIKSVVNVPVIAVGSLTPAMGEDILRAGKADFISLGRVQLADPELARKLARGEVDEIRPCTRCNEMCIGRVFFQKGLRCIVNAELGSGNGPLRPAQKPKDVIVVGGGAAGMEAARVAALRGHHVTLYERNDVLGGHLIEATVPSFKEDLRNYKDWLIRQITKLGVTVELGKEFTSQMVRKAKPDAMIIATGSVDSRPDIPGVDKPIVTTATDILLTKAKPGKMNILAGGGAIGCEVALHLAEQGKKATIVEMLPEVATDVPFFGRASFVMRLENTGVTILTNSRIVRIEDNGLTAMDENQKELHIPGDRVILAMGLVAQSELYEKLKGSVPEVYTIGDCVEPRRVGEATHDGYRIGSIL